MSEFALHPRLAEDCHQLGFMETSHLLLMDNALLPWFILVPVTQKRELYQLDAEKQYLIQQEINALSAFLMTQPMVEKLNIGALGNLVPQLHIHVIGRNPNDFCWPAPAWGQAGKTAYTYGYISQLTEILAHYLSTVPVHFEPANACSRPGSLQDST